MFTANPKSTAKKTRFSKIKNRAQEQTAERFFAIAKNNP
jgi:hypothetical protein